MLTRIQRWLKGLMSTEKIAACAPGEFETYGSWHGDHWQNLLCSPMDARHYVMEDWCAEPQPHRPGG